MKRLSLSIFAALLGLDAAAATLQEIIDAAADGATVTLAADWNLDAPVRIGKSLTVDGAGHSVTAPGTVFEVAGGAGDWIYVQLRNLTIAGATGVSVNAGADETCLAALDVWKCSIAAADGIVYANGGGTEGFSYGNDGFGLPKVKCLSVRQCEITAAGGESSGAGVRLSGMDSASGANCNAMVAMTSIAGFADGVAVGADVKGGTLFVGGTTAQGAYAFDCDRPVSCAAQGMGLYFWNAHLAGGAAAVFLGDGASGTVLKFSGARGEMFASEGDAAISASGAGAVAEIVFADGSGCDAEGCEILCGLRSPESWREYAAVAEKVSGASPVAKTVKEFAAAKGAKIYATVAEALADFDADELAISLSFGEDGMPVVSQANAFDLFGVKVQVKYSGELGAAASWRDWSNGIIQGAPPEKLFFKAVPEADE